MAISVKIDPSYILWVTLLDGLWPYSDGRYTILSTITQSSAQARYRVSYIYNGRLFHIMNCVSKSRGKYCPKPTCSPLAANFNDCKARSITI